jgi:uncharacterized integral membrane protein
MKNGKTILIVIGVVLAAIVALQNTQPVPTRVLWVTIEMPRALLLLTVLAIGVLVGLTARWHRARKPV